MAAVSGIGKFLGREMLGAVDELRERIVDGEICSLAIMAEIAGESEAVAIVQGRFQSDPYRALLALERLRHRLHRRLDRRQKPSSEFSGLG